MNLVESALSWAILLFEVALCVVVFLRRVERSLPLFAAYASTCAISCLLVICVYRGVGYDTAAAYWSYWISTYVQLLARSLAIVELCAYGFKNYRGIWALSWRVLGVLSIVLVGRAAIDAWGQPKGIAIFGITLGRDLALASVAVLAVLVVIRNYYGIGLDSFQRLIAAGVCLNCVVDAIGNTVILNLYTHDFLAWFSDSQRTQWPALWPLVRRAQDAWSSAHLISFMVSIAIWCYALRKPLPANAEKPQLLPARVYREISPAINVRLTAFNDRLVELLKP